MPKIDQDDLNGFMIDEFIKTEARAYHGSKFALMINKKGTKISFEFNSASNHDFDDHESFFKTLDVAQNMGLDLIVKTDPEFNGPNAHPAEKSLVERLQPYNIIQKGFKAYMEDPFEEPEYVQMLTQCDNPSKFPSFLAKCFSVLNVRGHMSLEGRRPNYKIRPYPLILSLSEYIERPLIVPGLPKLISGRSGEFEDVVTQLINNSEYVTAIVQKGGSSFAYSDQLQNQVTEIVKGLQSPIEKSKAIHEWITSNITYGKEKRSTNLQYRSALQVYEDREGVCGESAALQVTMERLVGNIAYLVEVGDTHAVAAHLQPNGDFELIDTTIPQGYGVPFDRFSILSDDHDLAGYK